MSLNCQAPRRLPDPRLSSLLLAAGCPSSHVFPRLCFVPEAGPRPISLNKPSPTCSKLFNVFLSPPTSYISITNSSATRIFGNRMLLNLCFPFARYYWFNEKSNCSCFSKSSKHPTTTTMLPFQFMYVYPKARLY